MPITFSVTCDTDAELARFLENFRYAAEMAAGTGTAKASATATKPAPAKKETAAPKSVKKATTTKAAKVAAKPKKAVKPPAKPKAVKAVKASAKAPKPARKPGKLTPIIDTAIKEVIKRGKPFRSKDVTELVMKKSPDLNESSVTTGVSKLLSETSLKYDSIKDAVGRPYKLYKP
jgi:outer membrane biosynthesis protein TonB